MTVFRRSLCFGALLMFLHIRLKWRNIHSLSNSCILPIFKRPYFILLWTYFFLRVNVIIILGEMFGKVLFPWWSKENSFKWGTWILFFSTTAIASPSMGWFGSTRIFYNFFLSIKSFSFGRINWLLLIERFFLNILIVRMIPDESFNFACHFVFIESFRYQRHRWQLEWNANMMFMWVNFIEMRISNERNDVGLILSAKELLSIWGTVVESYLCNYYDLVRM